MTNIQKRLFELEDLKYREFTSKLIPNIDKKKIIGVRNPQIRTLAKEIYKSGEYKKFIANPKHKYHEENMLHMMILEQYKDYDECIEKVEEFLPYIDNWAVSDTCTPKCFSKNKDKLIKKAIKWCKSKDTYTLRYGVGTLMSLYLDDDFKDEYLTIVLKIKSDEYYVNMMRAWYFATALAKQWDKAVKVIESKKLDRFTQNKSIQKARESYRIDKEKKEYLKTFKV